MKAEYTDIVKISCDPSNRLIHVLFEQVTPEYIADEGDALKVGNNLSVEVSAILLNVDTAEDLVTGLQKSINIMLEYIKQEKK